MLGSFVGIARFVPVLVLGFGLAPVSASAQEEGALPTLAHAATSRRVNEARINFERSSRDYGVAASVVGGLAIAPFVGMSFRAPGSGSLTVSLAGGALFPGIVSLAMGACAARARRGDQDPELLARELRIASIPAFILGGAFMGAAATALVFDVLVGRPQLMPWALGGAAAGTHLGVLAHVHADRLVGRQFVARAGRGPRLHVVPAGFGLVGWW